MNVELLTYTPDAEKIIAAAAKLCYSKSDVAALMENLTPENISVIVDFSGKEVGTFTIKPTIVVKGDAFTSVGAVGSYSVSATLREVVEETVPEETEG